MDKAKDEGEEPDDGRTPFERLTEFARRIIRVQKGEVAEPKPDKPKRRSTEHRGST